MKRNQPHYNLIQTDAGWHSTLCAGNNRVLLTTTRKLDSESHANSEVNFIKEYPISKESSKGYGLAFERRESKDKKHYFCISYFDDPKQKRIDIWISETYNTRQGMEKGIASVLRNCKTEDVRVVDRRSKK